MSQAIEDRDLMMTHKSSKGTRFLLYYNKEASHWQIDFSTYIGHSTYGIYSSFEKAERNFYIIKDRG